MSQNEHINPIKPPIRANKNFIYKGKKYPIYFSMVKMYSNYFYKNKVHYKSIEDIELKPDNYEIVDEAIPMFIACCQNEPFDINDSNIFSLYQLSIQYDVPVLNKLTSQYINKNQKQLIFQSILYKLQYSNVNIDLSAEEDLIASNFFDYIKDEQLVSLPVNVLYRIINNQQLKINSMDLTKQGQFIDFLFKCLDKHQREASILFLNLDIENERIGVLTQLLNRYSNIFDFNFINSKYLSKSASFLLNELQKLKIEFTSKISEMESENKKQREYFVSAQNSFDLSKSDLLNSNRSLEDKVLKLERKLSQIEGKLNEQSHQLERYTKIKVTKIKINSEPNFLRPGSSVTLTALVKPYVAFNDSVEWRIIQEVHGTVEIESKNDKTLVLRCLKSSKKVTVVASALDGSGVTSSKEFNINSLQGTIEINVQQDQTIKGTIKITGGTLDTSRSRYILNKCGDATIGEEAYQGGSNLDRSIKEFSFTKPSGEYFMHVFAVDNFGVSKEFVSKAVTTRGAPIFCGFTGGVQSVELEPGSYKLEAWGAQGGSFDQTHHGGFGGYSTGTINLSKKTTMYVVVGKSTSSESGGFNGGGSGGVYSNSNYTFTSYGGGGASHIGLKPGQLSTFSGDYSNNLLIAAGGGGGATGTASKDHKYYNSVGGCGGGITGGIGVFNAGYDSSATGGTQSSGGKNNYDNWNGCGKFGQGSNCEKHPGNHEGGGGGGGFYGGGSGGNSGPGGGGSGYINTSKLANAFMYGYKVSTSSSAESITFSTDNFSTGAISNYAKQNDGYVKITPL